MDLATTEEARDALARELKRVDADNPVGAAKALGRVASRAQLSYDGQWASFTLSAEKALKPWLGGRARVMAEGIVAGCREQGARQRAELSCIATSVASRYPTTVIEAPDPVVARVRCLADVAPEEVTWLWVSRIPRGKLSEIVGDPGVGKSMLAAELVSALTAGRPLPGELGGRARLAVLLLSAEDGAGDTIRPRLDRAKADLDRVHIFDGLERPDGGTTPLDLRDPAHRRQLAETIERLAVGLLVIDPLAAYLGGIDSHRDADVRGVLAPLAELAESSGCAILSIRHLNKGSASRAIYRAGGSIGFTAAARSSMLVGRMDEESDERALVTLKSNLAAPAPPAGFSLEGGRFRWTGTPDVGASDLLRPDADSDERGDRKATEKWLLDALRDGPVASAEVFEKAAAELSVSKATVKRVKRDLGDAVEAYRESHGNAGGGHWMWRLARGSPPLEPLAKPEFEPLARTVVPQGFPAPDGPRNPQGAQVNVSEPLAKSGDLFEGIDDDPSV